MSKVGTLTKFLDGTHVMNDDLATYHSARHARDACRARDGLSKYRGVQAALKNHRVMVSLGMDGRVRVYRPDNQSEIYL